MFIILLDVHLQYYQAKYRIECGWLHGLKFTDAEICPMPTDHAIPAPWAEFSVILRTCIKGSDQ
jgi:hypothetical protein